MGAIFFQINGSPAMVEMQMGEQNIGNIGWVKTVLLQRIFKGILAVGLVKTEEFLGLFAAQSGINQHQPVSVFNEQTTHGPGAQIVFIGRIVAVPKRFRYNTEHGSTVQLEGSG
jgi:hypothetical protein